MITVCGEAEPQALGRVMMPEHLHSDVVDWTPGPRYGRPIYGERLTSEDLRRYLHDDAQEPVEDHLRPTANLPGWVRRVRSPACHARKVPAVPP